MKRSLSIEEITRYLEWRIQNDLDSTKRKVLISIGIESSYNTAVSRKQSYLRWQTCGKIFEDAAKFGYEFDKPEIE